MELNLLRKAQEHPSRDILFNNDSRLGSPGRCSLDDIRKLKSDEPYIREDDDLLDYDVGEAVTLFTVFEGFTDSAIDMPLKMRLTKEEIKNYSDNAMNICLTDQQADTLLTYATAYCKRVEQGGIDQNNFWHEFEKPLSEMTI